MKTALIVKGIREPHEAKKKSFDLGGNRTHDLRIRHSTFILNTTIGRKHDIVFRHLLSVKLISIIDLEKYSKVR